MNHQESLTSYIAAFVAELFSAGVRDVVVSPGSRSTPMAMVMAEHPELRLHIHVDERSAAFYALGIAKAKKKPIALLCTSGTAAANYFPAVVEAFHSRVPLIVLTADRPHELRDVGAPQAIDQIHLYGKHVKWFVEMSPPEGTVDMLRYARMVCARAAATALSAPAGPVHLNFPFREPLVPKLDRDDLFTFTERVEGYVASAGKRYSLSDDELEALRKEILMQKKGVIICGPIEDGEFADAVIQLAEQLHYPILADPLSQLRSGEHVDTYIIDTYDTFLRNEDARISLKPDIIIRFGAMPVSKHLTFFVKENYEAKQWVIDSGGGWRDPSLLATTMIYANEADFCRDFASSLEEKGTSEYCEKWQNLNQLTKEALKKVKDIPDLSEGRLFYELSRLLPSHSTLFVGNSMPIRDLDTFFHYNQKSVKVMANRGVNGIDGIVSTALGAATVSQPLYLVVGDLSFFPDLNGLIQAKLYQINIKIIVINNNGGGIFSFLPQSSEPKNFERLFGTPLDLQFEHAIQMYNGSYTHVTDWDHFTSSFVRNLQDNGLSVMEITTNRDNNLSEHRNLWDFVSREISQFLHGEKE